LLKNQVDLATELLIEKAHEFNETLIGEINKYEKDTIDSFKNKKLKRNKDTEKLIRDINKFHTDTNKYLDEFRIDDKVVEESLDNVNKMIQDLSDEDSVPKYSKMEFVKNEDKLDTRLLGCLVIKTAGSSSLLESENLKQIDLKNINTDYRSNLNLFQLNNGNYVAFYIDQNSLLKFRTFDGDGKIVNNMSGVLIKTKINSVNVVQMDNKFAFSCTLARNFEFFYVENQRIVCHSSEDGYKKHLMILVDENFRFLKHVHLDSPVILTAANKSNIMCIGEDQPLNWFVLNSDLQCQKMMPLESISINERVIDLKMNESQIFVLCSSRKLVALDVKTFKAVKVFFPGTGQIQLLSQNYLVLFDSLKRFIHQYDHSEDFKKVGSHVLPQHFNNYDFNKFICDESKRYSFYNSKCIKCVSLD
jgi:hypothetical protein